MNSPKLCLYKLLHLQVQLVPIYSLSILCALREKMINSHATKAVIADYHTYPIHGQKLLY